MSTLFLDQAWQPSRERLKSHDFADSWLASKTLSARKDIQLSKIIGSEDHLPPVLGGHIRWMPLFSIDPEPNDRQSGSIQSVGPGGAGRDRTDDLRLAKPALSQLSYSPFARIARGPGEPRSEVSSVRPVSRRRVHRDAIWRHRRWRAGGPGWTRTTDLPLIRRTL